MKYIHFIYELLREQVIEWFPWTIKRALRLTVIGGLVAIYACGK